MQTRFSRRLLRRNKEEPMEQPREAFLKEKKAEPRTTDSSSRASDTAIAELAKSFMQLQANSGKSAADNTNQEVVGLLEKLNKQLANLQQTVGSKERSDERGQEEAPQNSEELCKLFSQYLQSNGQEKDSAVNSELLSGQGKATGRKATGGAQTAQELLTRTQYELANELEDSLKKLKQVILESEKVAARISQMLDTENK